MICELLTPPVLRLTGLRHRYLQPRFDLEARPEVRVVSALQDRDVSVIGVYGGFIDKFPSGSWMNRSLTLRTGQCHVQRYMKPLLQRIEHGEIDPTRVITHTLPLEQAPRGYDIFKNKEDNCEKVVLKPGNA
jgi:hypothetical protein